MRKLTERDVKFTIECLPEDTPYQGNCYSDEDTLVEETEQWIKKQLESGNKWAWCTAKVTGQWQSLIHTEYLGKCSYDSEKFFMFTGYYDNMKQEIVNKLNRQLEEILEGYQNL